MYLYIYKCITYTLFNEYTYLEVESITHCCTIIISRGDNRSNTCPTYMSYMMTSLPT